MNNKFIEIIATALSISKRQVENTLKLLEEGNTIPFVSRYRKEVTESLDEQQIGSIKQQYAKLTEIEKRRETIINSIEKQGKMTNELRAKLEKTTSLSELEDIYLPFKPKKKTRATIAKAKGLEPLAKILFNQENINIYEKAESFITKEVETIEDALQGARDIIAEWINEDQTARNKIRKLYDKEAIIRCKVVSSKKEEAEKYKDYFNSEENLKRCVSHRLLAMRRGEEEGFLKLSIATDDQEALDKLENIYIKGDSLASQQMSIAISDSYKRLLGPSMETEFRAISKDNADEEAIKVFSDNLRQLLLASPLGQKNVLAIDPGYRTGCKVVCLDNQGNLLHNETIYPHPPQSEIKQALKKIASLVNAYKIEAIAIGNGTASRETEALVKRIKYDRDVQVFVVSENGASVYSASSAAREEFPQYDVTVRGSVSIGRRLMDPLAELVKIEPKSIGVGQYQHDINQNKLSEALNQVVESCVNLVGVNLNTASKHLLTYVSGLGPQLAQNIVDYRKENGVFNSRKELKKVKRMGGKAFEQCAGFLRIPDGKHPLDNSAVHPESYFVVKKMAENMNCLVRNLLEDESLRNKIKIENYVTEQIGLPTLKDIMEELAKPGRDPRTKVQVFEFEKDIHAIEDLKVGIVLSGIVTNITNFGAFVDIGIKENGLVHISQLANRFVKNPSEIVQIHQHVKVKVIDVDIERKRIQLSMKDFGRMKDE